MADRCPPRRPGGPAVLVAAHGQARTRLGWIPAYTSLAPLIESA